jgi:hypothetical protein
MAAALEALLCLNTSTGSDSGTLDRIDKVFAAAAMAMWASDDIKPEIRQLVQQEYTHSIRRAMSLLLDKKKKKRTICKLRSSWQIEALVLQRCLDCGGFGYAIAASYLWADDHHDEGQHSVRP